MTQAESKESETALAKAQAETRTLLALLTEAEPDADALKDRWYAQGWAVREAIRELRQAEANQVEVNR